MIDDAGDEWVTISDAAQRVRVRVETIRVWRTRGRVRAHGSGRHVFVEMGDVMAAEREWRQRENRKALRVDKDVAPV